MTETVSVKIFRHDKISEIFDLMKSVEDGNESQAVADMFAAAVVGAEMLGWETADMFSVISQQHPLAVKLCNLIDSHEEES